jgi:hypothetical protein
VGGLSWSQLLTSLLTLITRNCSPLGLLQIAGSGASAGALVQVVRVGLELTEESIRSRARCHRVSHTGLLSRRMRNLGELSIRSIVVVVEEGKLAVGRGDHGQKRHPVVFFGGEFPVDPDGGFARGIVNPLAICILRDTLTDRDFLGTDGAGRRELRLLGSAIVVVALPVAVQICPLELGRSLRVLEHGIALENLLLTAAAAKIFSSTEVADHSASFTWLLTCVRIRRRDLEASQKIHALRLGLAQNHVRGNVGASRLRTLNGRFGEWEVVVGHGW